MNRVPLRRVPALSTGHLHGQTAGGVNRRAHLHPDVVRILRHLELVPLQRHRQTARRLEHCELVTDALTRARAERDESKVAGHLVGVQTAD